MPPHTICRLQVHLLVKRRCKIQQGSESGEKGRGESVQEDELFSGSPVIPKCQTHHFAELGQKSDSPMMRRQSSVWHRDLGRQQRWDILKHKEEQL